MKKKIETYLIKKALNAIALNDDTDFILEVSLHDLAKSQLKEGLLVLKVNNKYLIIKECEVENIYVMKSGILKSRCLVIRTDIFIEELFFISKKKLVSDYKEYIGDMKQLTKMISNRNQSN